MNRRALCGGVMSLLPVAAAAQRGDRPTLSPNISILEPWRGSAARVDLPEPEPPVVLDLGPAKLLMVDDWGVERRSGLSRTLHQPRKHPENPLLTPERSWEQPSVLLYGTVMFDPNRKSDRFRMWYLCFTPPESGDDAGRGSGRICYATSADGLRWDRPDLGLVEYRGSRANNIVLDGPHGFSGIVEDPRDPEPRRRFKGMVRTRRGHEAIFSPDGIRWEPPVLLPLDGYDRSSIHWDPVRRLWVASTKSWYRSHEGAEPWRGRGYQESGDFFRWPQKARFLTGTEPESDEIVYGLEMFYYESLFLGAWGRYRQDPDGRLDLQLAAGHTPRHWRRVSESSWIPLSPLPEGFRRLPSGRAPITGVDPLDPRVPWDYGNNSLNSLGPIRVGDELWLYYSGRTSDHRSRPQTGAIGLATQRLDGFVSLDAGEEEGVLVTRPLRLTDSPLRVNAHVRDGGSLTGELVDETGRAVRGFSRKDCRALTGDSVRHELRWNGAGDLRQFRTPVRLRLFLRRTQLFAVWTGSERRWTTPTTETWLS